MAGWGPRVDQWKALPEHERCYETGCVLLVHNNNPYATKKWQAHLDEGLKARGALLKKSIQARLSRSGPNDDGFVDMMKYADVYPPNCLNNTVHHKRFQAGQEEHSRLCEDHAREQGWLW